MGKRRLIIIGGGVRSGKSRFALARAQQLGKRRAFVATAEAADEEMRQRIDAHRRERDASFTTIEAPLAIVDALETLAATEPAYDVVVLDCLTLWLSNLLMQEQKPSGSAAETEIERFIAHAAAGWPFDLVAVTNEVGLGLVPPSELGRRFRDLAGGLHQRLASEADEVYLGAMGLLLQLKPSSLTANHGDTRGG
jgi:adenosylcobinamide kinase/adenosylcobinamide-phosphate guanylyltransferase